MINNTTAICAFMWLIYNTAPVQPHSYLMGSQAEDRILREHQCRYAIAVTVLNISRYAQYHNGFSHQLVFQCALSWKYWVDMTICEKLTNLLLCAWGTLNLSCDNDQKKVVQTKHVLNLYTAWSLFCLWISLEYAVSQAYFSEYHLLKATVALRNMSSVLDWAG